MRISQDKPARVIDLRKEIYFCTELKAMHRVEPTPLLLLESVSGYRNLYVKDESVQINGTFKDRLSRRALERYPKDRTFGAISYGNTAISLARSVADTGNAKQVVVFVPHGFNQWRFGPSTTGATIRGQEILEELENLAYVIPVDLSSSLLTDADLLELARLSGLSISNFINVTEGIDTPAYVDIIKEVVQQLGRVPDICVVPYGAGILCNEIRDHLDRLGHGVVIPISVGSPHSLARMLYGPVWVDVDQLRRTGVAFSRHRSPDRTGAPRPPYPVFLVREDEIVRGLEIAKDARISAEPSGSAGLGILPRLKELHPKLDPARDTVVVINTGNGIDGFLRRHK